MTSAPDFLAGNTRLRARLPALLSARDYDRLVGVPLEVVVDRLHETAYRPYLDPRHADDIGAGSGTGIDVLDVVTRRLRDLLRGVRGLYGGVAGRVVGVLLARHDLRDVLALLRGARTGQPVADRLAAVIGVGAVDLERAAAVATAADGAAAVTRLAALRLPDRATARALPAAWERFELNTDPDEFETAVAVSVVGSWISLLQRTGRTARPVLDVVREECDRANLLAVLADPAAQAPRVLPAGLIGVPALLAARRGDLAAVRAARPGWRDALDRFCGDGDLIALEWSIEVAMWRRAVRGLRRGDPLGADIPVGYVIAAECEARNVRLLLLGARRGDEAPPALIA
jgi:vacuolar-type H+-ATPase subunit C/Vma6